MPQPVRRAQHTATSGVFAAASWTDADVSFRIESVWARVLGFADCGFQEGGMAGTVGGGFIPTGKRRGHAVRGVGSRFMNGPTVSGRRSRWASDSARGIPTLPPWERAGAAAPRFVTCAGPAGSTAP